MKLKNVVRVLILLIAAGCSSNIRTSEQSCGQAATDFRRQMKRFGIRKADVELHFTWIAGPTSPKPVRTRYFTEYNSYSSQIIDSKTLDEIKQSGLEASLQSEALTHVRGGAWLDLPETPPFPAAADVSIFDDVSRASHPGMYWRDDSSRTKWQQALFSNDLAEITGTLAAGKISSRELDEGLFWGCTARRIGLLKLFLKSGANVNAVEDHDNERVTALMVAVRWRNAEALKLLVGAGAKAGARDKYGETELTTLLNDSKDQSEIVGPLLESGVAVNAANMYGLTALMRASRAQPESVIKMLIEHGAEVNAKDKKGDTALSVANENGNNAAARVLIAAGAKD